MCPPRPSGGRSKTLLRKLLRIPGTASAGHTPEMLSSSKQLELLLPANTGALWGPGTEPQLGFFTQMHMYVCHTAKQPLPSKVLEKKLIPWGEWTERTPPVGPRADGDVDEVLSLNALKGHLHAPGRGVQRLLKQSHVEAPKRNQVKSTSDDKSLHLFALRVDFFQRYQIKEGHNQSSSEFHTKERRAEASRRIRIPLYWQPPSRRQTCAVTNMTVRSQEQGDEPLNHKWGPGIGPVGESRS
ncbi:Heat Shock 70 Kda Protein 12A [Manis pentadactyla]|nr:Heat Shock 70 Kda Protein 12A [Manis pentadactyla]